MDYRALMGDRLISVAKDPNIDNDALRVFMYIFSKYMHVNISVDQPIHLPQNESSNELGISLKQYQEIIEVLDDGGLIAVDTNLDLVTLCPSESF
jgi:hypothetical protein